MPDLPGSGGEKPLTVHEILRERLLRRAGLLRQGEDLRSLERDLWSPDFELRMRARLMMGSFRYGSFRSQVPPVYRNVTSAVSRLNRYLATGNLELLVDAANLCLIEYERGLQGAGEHPEPHWSPEDDGVHTAPMGDR